MNFRKPLFSLLLLACAIPSAPAGEMIFLHTPATTYFEDMVLGRGFSSQTRSFTDSCLKPPEKADAILVARFPPQVKVEVFVENAMLVLRAVWISERRAPREKQFLESSIQYGHQAFLEHCGNLYANALYSGLAFESRVHFASAADAPAFSPRSFYGLEAEGLDEALGEFIRIRAQVLSANPVATQTFWSFPEVKKAAALRTEFVSAEVVRNFIRDYFAVASAEKAALPQYFEVQEYPHRENRLIRRARHLLDY